MYRIIFLFSSMQDLFIVIIEAKKRSEAHDGTRLAQDNNSYPINVKDDEAF